MLTPDDLRKMTPEARTALFDQLAVTWYGERKTDPAIGADFDVRRETVSRWRINHNVPWSVIFTLERWNNSEVRLDQIMTDWASIPGDLATATAQLGRVASTLARIARLSATGASPHISDVSQPPAPSSGR